MDVTPDTSVNVRLVAVVACKSMEYRHAVRYFRSCPAQFHEAPYLRLYLIFKALGIKAKLTGLARYTR
jgi:hypothetical protein